MTCPTREELVAVLDGALAPDALAAARGHVEACAGCRAELARLEAAVALLRVGSPAPAPSPDFAARLAARLAAEPAPRPGRAVGWRSGDDAPRRRGLAALLAPRWRLAAAAALAAAVAAAVLGARAVHRARSEAEELAVAERLDLLENLEVVASVGEVETPDDVAVIAALGDPRSGEGRP